MNKRKTSKRRPIQLKPTTYPTYLDLFETSLYELFSPRSKNRLVDYEFITSLFNFTLFVSYLNILNVLATYLIVFLGIFLGTNMISHQLKLIDQTVYAAQTASMALENNVLGVETQNSSCQFTVENTNLPDKATYKLVEPTVTVCVSSTSDKKNWFLDTNGNILPVEVLISDEKSSCSILTDLVYGSILYISDSESLVSESNSCSVRFE